MKYIICYDIKENALRARVVKCLETWALRIQFSVFSGNFSTAEVRAVQEELLHIVKAADRPLLLIVPVCKACEKSIWMHGQPLEEDVPFLLV